MIMDNRELDNYESLTEQERIFIDALYDPEINPFHDPDIAKKVAGYDSNVSCVSIMRKVKEQVKDDTHNYFVSRSPYAAKLIHDIASSKINVPGQDKLLNAAVQILDRAGIVKKEKQQLEVKASDGIVIIPAINTGRQDSDE